VPLSLSVRARPLHRTLPVLLDRLNRVLPEVKEPHMYATFTGFRLGADGSVFYALAASPPILQWHASGRTLSHTEEGQFPLGQGSGADIPIIPISQELHLDWRKATCPEARNCRRSRRLRPWNNDSPARETRTDRCYYYCAIPPGHAISKPLGEPMHTYCVVLRPQHSLHSLYPRKKRYYLRANSAAQAMLIASEDPEWLVFGVEPARMSARPPQSERSVSTENSIVA
jgi:Stage II sporulation protein E (SpoIIE)